MSPLRLVFLALAVWGAIHPVVWFTLWFQEHGWRLGPMVEAWYANAAVAGLAWDLTIASIAFAVWVVTESLSRRDWIGLVAIPVIFGIGLSCALPLYLFLRSRPAALAASRVA